MTADTNSPEPQPFISLETQKRCCASVQALQHLGSFMLQSVHKPEDMLRFLLEYERQVDILSQALCRQA